jgi:hypothetical protein
MSVAMSVATTRARVSVDYNLHIIQFRDFAGPIVIFTDVRLLDGFLNTVAIYHTVMTVVAIVIWQWHVVRE